VLYLVNKEKVIVYEKAMWKTTKEDIPVMMGMCKNSVSIEE
jgi:hypothetical protein